MLLFVGRSHDEKRGRSLTLMMGVNNV